MWAASSWGRYWGWDPKEVWSLVAFLCYMAILHAKVDKMIGQFGVAAISIAAFQTILFTYLGVNFVLTTGMHSYGMGDSPVVMWMLVTARGRGGLPGLGLGGLPEEPGAARGRLGVAPGGYPLRPGKEIPSSGQRVAHLSQVARQSCGRATRAPLSWRPMAKTPAGHSSRQVPQPRQEPASMLGAQETPPWAPWEDGEAGADARPGRGVDRALALPSDSQRIPESHSAPRS